MSSNIKFVKLDGRFKIIDFLRIEIKKRSRDAIERNGVFRIGVSGGSIANYLSSVFYRMDDLHFDKFRIYFCDERFVDATDKDSTYGLYKKSLIPYTTLKEENLIGVNTTLSLKECAEDYEQKILKEFHLKAGEIPQFDILFLGIGPDGHTCSIFPQQYDVLRENDHLIVAVENSPKPPPQRVTMTLPLINNAKCVIFLAIGEEKAEIIKKIFIEKETLPASMVNPVNDSFCVLDEASGRYIN